MTDTDPEPDQPLVMSPWRDVPPSSASERGLVGIDLDGPFQDGERFEVQVGYGEPGHEVVQARTVTQVLVGTGMRVCRLALAMGPDRFLSVLIPAGARVIIRFGFPPGRAAAFRWRLVFAGREDGPEVWGWGGWRVV